MRKEIEAKLKKETSLRNGFEAIYKEVVDEFIDLSEDFYPSHDDFSKRFNSELQKIKPTPSKSLAITVEGLESNEEDFWAVSFTDNHDNFVAKTLQIK